MVFVGEFINLQDVPLHYFQLSSMCAAEKLALKKKLKSELDQLLYSINNIAGMNNSSNSDGQCALSSENYQAPMDKKRKICTMDEQPKDVDCNFNNEEIMATEKLEAASADTGASKGDKKEGKGQQMDVSKMRQCASVLKNLITHPAGWVFNQPVDPVKLKIPDYFSIISKPMDLGTIKHKLERKLYWSTHQFAADVRLTFANAMEYNPPRNDIHIMAKELNNIFCTRWKSLEEKWRQDARQHSVMLETQKQTLTPRQLRHKKSAYNTNSLPKKSLTCAKKLKLRKDLPSAEVIKTCAQGLVLDSHKDIDSERSSGRESHACHAIDVGGKPTEGMHRANLNSDSHVVDEDNAQNSPTPPASAVKGGDDPFKEQLSLSKALRAAKLKSRFADTILKAQQKTLLSHGEKVDPTRMQRERENLEKKQQEEKARIEAQVKAAEVAAQMKAKAELKMQREREREAARLALQKMEKTVDIDENTQILKDLESLSYSQPGSNFEMLDEVVVNFMDGVELQSNVVNPLEKLGLFMKNDDLDEEAVDWISATGNGVVEEGEIGL